MTPAKKPYKNMQKISSNIPRQISERNKKARDVLLEPAVHQIFF